MDMISTDSFKLSMMGARDDFMQSVRNIISDEEQKRQGFCKALDDFLLQAESVSEADFFEMIGMVAILTQNLPAVLSTAGIAAEVAEQWQKKRQAPNAAHRKNTLFLLMGYAKEYVAKATIQADLVRLVEEFGGERVTSSVPAFEKTLEELELFDHVAYRIKQAIKNNETKTLGELLAMSEGEFLRTPNIGRQSLRELNIALKHLYGMEVGSLTRKQLEEYMDTLPAE